MVDARLFQALSDRTRLNILALLARGTVNVSRIVAHLGCAQPAVSRHLRVLREAELIADKRKGKQVEYSINRRALAAAATFLGDLASVEPGAASRRQEPAAEPAAKQSRRSASRTVASGAPKRTVKAAPPSAPARERGRAAVRGRGEPAEPPEPRGDFAPSDNEFVVKPRRKAGLDDFLL